MNDKEKDYNQIINEIFDEIKKKGIELSVEVNFKYNWYENEIFPVYFIESVNGFKSIKEYEEKLELLSKICISKINNLINTIPVSERVIFLDILINYAEDLAGYIIEHKIKYSAWENIPESTIIFNSFYSCKVNIINDDGNHKKSELKILKNLTDYAEVWLKVVKIIREKISFMLYSIELNHNNYTDKENINSSVPKIKTKLSVSKLAALFKILTSDNDIFVYEEVNKSKLFEILANNFQTCGTENCSFNNIKNNFYSPDQKDLDFWGQKLPKFNPTYLKKLSKNSKNKSQE